MGAQATDVVIVGMGPAGIFCALSLLEHGHAGRIVMVDKGLSVRERRCPKQLRGPSGACVGCEPCRITAGFSGAGAFSDGKLSLSAEVGGDLPERRRLRWPAGRHRAGGRHLPARSVRTRTWRALRRQGAAAPTYAGRAIKAGLKLVDCPIRHLGTERARDLYARIEEPPGGVQALTCVLRPPARRCSWRATPARACAPEGPEGACELRARHTVVATGRARAPTGWRSICSRARHGARARAPWTSACAWRCRNEIMEDGKRRPLRVQAHRLPQALQEQGAHVLPEPRRRS